MSQGQVGKISCVFLCGDRSAYGMAHLAPIAEHFQLKAVVVADDQRWAHFRRALLGGPGLESITAGRGPLSWGRTAVMAAVEVLRALRRSRYLRSAGAPVVVVNDVNQDGFVEQLTAWSADVLLSAAYPQILSERVLRAARRGAINFHPSLLPPCRGAHPPYWCLATGEEKGGVTAHFMTTRIDAGDIVAQAEIPLRDLYYDQLYAALVSATPGLVADVARFLSDSSARATPQDPAAATFFRGEREIHRRLDFGLMSARELHDRIRAGRAYGIHRGLRVEIVRADIVSANRNLTNGIVVTPGVVVDLDPLGVVIRTKDQELLAVREVRRAGRKMSAGRWALHNRVEVGERFD